MRDRNAAMCTHHSSDSTTHPTCWTPKLLWMFFQFIIICINYIFNNVSLITYPEYSSSGLFLTLLLWGWSWFDCISMMWDFASTRACACAGYFRIHSYALHDLALATQHGWMDLATAHASPVGNCGHDTEVRTQLCSNCIHFKTAAALAHCSTTL